MSTWRQQAFKLKNVLVHEKDNKELLRAKAGGNVVARSGLVRALSETLPFGRATSSWLPYWYRFLSKVLILSYKILDKPDPHGHLSF